MELDAELDAAQEGSGGSGPQMAFTNIEGPDVEVDEDGDSPSTYLNLNQEDEENLESEDDDDVEGPNQDNDDAEGQNQDNDDTQTSFQVRRGRGPNKQPIGRHVIVEISDARDPLHPNVVASAWRTTCGTLVRDHVAITYRLWRGGQNLNKRYVVPDDIKRTMWNKLDAKFEFPKGCDMEKVRQRTMTQLGISFRNMKCRLYKKYHVQGKTPDFNQYPTLKPFWKAFVEYKDSEEARKISEANKANAKKNLYPHRTGSCGYAGKVATFQEMEEKVIRMGNTPMTAKYTERSKRYLYGHGVYLTEEGNLAFKSDEVKGLVESIDKAHDESSSGTFQPSRDNDELSYALKSKEHPGRTRGYGNIPWKHALQSNSDSYGKKRRKEIPIDIEAIVNEIVATQLAAALREKDQQLYEANQGNTLGANSTGRHSNCASTTLPENDENRYPIDDIKESTQCRLVTPVLGRARMVAYGLAEPLVEGTLFHDHLIPKGYAIVHLDSVKYDHRKSKLDYPGDAGEFKLEKNIVRYVLWRRGDIEFGDSDSDAARSRSHRDLLGHICMIHRHNSLHNRLERLHLSQK
ncbi:hypothetical protein PR202_gb07039 [Eleusine coracana subsp. coracana]|uniref:DUF8039 domain-containing protein n=1 Tax=Eleusine coracana subsp. coracana TaxID=191504 RepID=A0AAV5EBM5_ELECO|nr:hypothetical protein PR202_gb07039 [Eleusine coracana subsp. coracana]